jgi:hypothetical protein
MDLKIVQAINDPDNQLRIFLSCGAILLVRLFGGLSSLDAVPWAMPLVSVGFVVSGCFLAVSCAAAFLRFR